MSLLRIGVSAISCINAHWCAEASCHPKCPNWPNCIAVVSQLHHHFLPWMGRYTLIIRVSSCFCYPLISLSHFIPNMFCQERVIVMSGEEDALRKAVVEILRSIQGDAHLEATAVNHGKWMWWCGRESLGTKWRSMKKNEQSSSLGFLA